jgi:hypothetical protein
VAAPTAVASPTYDINTLAGKVASLNGTAGLQIRFSSFIEVSTQKPSSLTTPAVFEPAAFYGEERLWSFSVGARLGTGMRHGRMGRYGVAANLDAYKGH